MPGRKYNSSEYRYGFNGKEKDQDGEWGSQTVYDYGFRILNPAIGRFLSVDPLTASYPWYTPYQYAGNKPIKFIDLDGLEEAPNQADENIPTELANDLANERSHSRVGVGPNGDMGVYPGNLRLDKESVRIQYEADKKQAKWNRDYTGLLFETVAGIGVGISSTLASTSSRVSAAGGRMWGAFKKMLGGSSKAKPKIKPPTKVDVQPEFFDDFARMGGNALPPGKSKLNNKFIEGVDLLEGDIDIGWYDGETVFFDINSILKSPNYKGSVFKNLTERAEEIARNRGMSEVQINFSMVMNQRLKSDRLWAEEFGYHFSSEVTEFSTNVTWTKYLSE